MTDRIHDGADPAGGLSRRAVLKLALAAAPGWAAAQSFPAGPITVVVPLAPGDAADMTARAMGEEMSRILNTPVVPVNRPGAGGAVAAAAVVQAKKDGQTLLFAQNSALTFRPVLEPQSAAYDPQRDLVPLGLTTRTPSVLAVRSDAPFKTFAELVDHAKKNPGQVRLGHPGVGSVGDFCIRLVNALAGTDIAGIPHNGAAPVVTALRGGHIEGTVLAFGALSAQVKAGAFRGLATSSRVPDHPDIPTLRELGYREDLFGVWFSMLAPAGIPDPARKALVDAIEQAVKSPAIAARLAPMGIVQTYGTPEQLAAEIREETRRVAAMAGKAGLR